MTHDSSPELLALHGVRILGGPSAAALAERFGLCESDVREHLLDAQANGWVSRHDFYGESWSLTERGRAENERQLSRELEEAAARETVERVHAAVGPLNARHGQACTDWQLRRSAGASVENDHSDPVWDDRVLRELEAVDAELRPLVETLVGVLSRFAGHADRHTAALTRARAGGTEWIASPDRASCELVWIQFHEDLLATLGIPRGTDG